MATHLRTELVFEALILALWQRRPAAVIHHSDQGSQYTSIAFGQRYREAGVRPSMGSVGDCFDNAMCQSFFATLECELLDRRRFTTQVEARMAVFEFIGGLVQSSSPPFRPRLSFTDQLRKDSANTVNRKPITVYRIGVTPVGERTVGRTALTQPLGRSRMFETHPGLRRAVSQMMANRSDRHFPNLCAKPALEAADVMR
jgi:transposase InsO family protein